jgi:hypothetical protein
MPQPTIYKDFYVYALEIASLANGANTTGNINIKSDSDFELQKLSFFADISDATQTDASRVIPLVTAQITDSGSGRQLFDSALPIGAIFGDGRLPFILPTPKLFAKNTNISVNLSNYSNASTYGFTLLFIGRKIFRAGF